MTSTTESESALIRSDRRGRMLVGAEQREALLDEFERSGMSGMAFCKLHGLVYPTFASWRKKRRERPKPGAAAFAEVVVGDKPSSDLMRGSGGTLRVRLPAGAVIEISGRDQLPLLVELLTSLFPQRSC